MSQAPCTCVGAYAYDTDTGHSKTCPVEQWFSHEHPPFTPTPPRRPQHYALSPEPIDVIESWGLGFNLGNVIKYVARCGKKNDPLEDLQKAAYYVQREIELRSKSS